MNKVLRRLGLSSPAHASGNWGQDTISQFRRRGFAGCAEGKWFPVCQYRNASQIMCFVAGLLLCTPVSAQIVAGDTFADAADGGKLHVASRFICPAKIGPFERDAVGETDPQTGADFCAYAALDGVYGTIKLVPLRGPYDAKQSLANDFVEQEGSGGKVISENDLTVTITRGAPLAVYTRTYETAKLEDLHYRVQFAGAPIAGWAVETTIEFAEPRDLPEAQNFLHAVYDSAEREIATAAR